MIKTFLNRLALLVGATALIAGGWAFVPPPREAAAQFIDQSTYGGTSTGTANAQLITVANYTSNKVGVVLRFIPGFTNTGPTQLNVSGVGLVNVVRPSSIGNVALSGGEIQSGELTCVTYTGAAYQLSCNVDVTPIGKTVEFRGAATPRGVLIEDGSCVSTTTYAALFAVIGTTYGSCSAGLFAVPDSRGTMFAALDGQGANGSAGRITTASCATPNSVGLCGTETKTLAASQIPTIVSPVSVSGTASVAGNFSGEVQIASVSTGFGLTLFSANSGAQVWQAYSNGATISQITVSSFTSSGSVNASGTASSSNTGGAAHPVLNPILMGRRGIKY